MRPSGSTRPVIFGFILALGITLTLPYVAFGAARSFGGSARFRGSTIHGQRSFSRPFNRFGLRPFNRFGWVGVGGGVIDEPTVVIIQQFQSPAATEPREPATNRIYVQPRWVDGGYGVQVLQPGYWAEPKQAAER
jgi:hypothetical protein